VPEFEIVEMDGPFLLRWKNPPTFRLDLARVWG
jgi:hypothetical protein